MGLSPAKFCILALALGNVGLSVFGQSAWFEDIQLYQIYPRSFMDSDGDGIGDLKGVTSRLQHVVDTGATAAWLSPIFLSPMKDFGYDISDYYTIAPEYGTLDDFQELIEAADRLGLKIILDFVPNHTSDEHEWFQKSANRTPGYEDYYVWHSGKPDPQDPSKRLPPSNWLSVFRGSAWTWHEARQEFYYHQFLPEQPDLNYRSPRLVEDMKKVLRTWIARGAYGFRVDAIPHLFEVDPALFGGQYPDEPLSNATDDDQTHAYLDHLYTRDQPETFDMVYQWRAVLDEFPDSRILALEAAGDLDIMFKFYGNETSEGAHFPLNFQLVDIGNEPTAELVKASVDEWLEKVPPGRVSNWALGNHDNNRSATRYGYELSQGMLLVDLLLPGLGITYQGEELGMTNQPLSWEDTLDPAACRAGPAGYSATSRDPVRTPFQWDATPNAGFSNGSTTWLPVASNYRDVNLADQKAMARSYYKLFQSISEKRRSELHFSRGSVQTALPAPGVFAFARNYLKSTYVVVVSFNDSPARVNLRAHLDHINAHRLWVEISSLSSARSASHHDSVNPNSFEMTAYESLLLWGPA